MGRPICSVCCGTKRLVEIRCPEDCRYLMSAREHPAAIVRRQQQSDLALLVPFLRDLTERQVQLFFYLQRVVSTHESLDPQMVSSLARLLDDDVAEAASAAAATWETASKGIIYEHHATSPAGERLASAFRSTLREIGDKGGSAFERDAALSLRRIEQAAREVRKSAPVDAANQQASSRAYVDLLARLPVDRGAPGKDAPAESHGPSPLVLP